MILPHIINENIEYIKNINEPKFKINKAYYEYQNDLRIKKVLQGCKEGIISRSEVNSYFEDKQYEIGYFAAMIWGGVSVGGIRGNNLQKMIEVPPKKLLDIIHKCSEYVDKSEYKKAYDFMESKGKIPGLGDSFFTKIIFFIANGKRKSIIPPIFDKWTKLAFTALMIELGNELFLKKYIAFNDKSEIKYNTNSLSSMYEEYILQMNIWARLCETSVSNFETFIFGIDKRKDRSNNNIRIKFENIIKEYQKTFI